MEETRKWVLGLGSWSLRQRPSHSAPGKTSSTVETTLDLPFLHLSLFSRPTRSVPLTRVWTPLHLSLSKACEPHPDTDTDLPAGNGEPGVNVTEE